VGESALRLNELPADGCGIDVELLRNVHQRKVGGVELSCARHLFVRELADVRSPRYVCSLQVFEHGLTVDLEHVCQLPDSEPEFMLFD
jgi:hypothetical protein